MHEIAESSPMSPERDDRNDEQEPDTFEEEPPRSIFAATWFRAVLILIVLGVIGAVAVPYILDAVNAPATQQAVVKSAPPAEPPFSSAPMTSPPAARADKPNQAPPRATPSAPPTGGPEAKKAAPPAPVAKADAPTAKSATAPKTDAPAQSSVSSSAAVATDSMPPRAGASLSAAASPKPAAASPSGARPVKTGSAVPGAAGVYWVQVGAFKDEETARRLAARLREQNFKVAEVAGSPSTPAAAAVPAPAAGPAATAAPAGADQYNVFVTGLAPEELRTRLTAKGLAAEPSGAGVVITPTLPLRDAVALSKDLAVEGFKVQVRRAGGGDAARASTRPQASASATTTKAPAGDALYRVRVGSFTERTAAVAVLRELEAKGYKPFIARGEP